MTSRNVLRDWFATGKKPTATQFAEFFASFLHLAEDPITIQMVQNLQTTLAGKEPAIGAKKTAFNKDFGTAAGQVMAGDDARLLKAVADILDLYQVKATPADIEAAITALINGSTRTTLKQLDDAIIALQALVNGDDVNLDSVKELADYIKANKALIDSITTDKVNTSDVYNALDQAAAGKVLDARQGKVLKDLNDAINLTVQDHATRIAALEANPSGGATSFLGLSDTPASYEGMAGKVAKVKADESGLEFATDESSTTGVESAGMQVFALAGYNNVQPGHQLLEHKFVSPNGYPMFAVMVGDTLCFWEFNTVLGLRRIATIGALGSVSGSSSLAVGYDSDRNEIWVSSAVDTIKIINAATLTLKETVTIAGIPLMLNYNMLYDTVTQSMFLATTTLYKIDAATRTILASVTIHSNYTGMHYIGAYGIIFMTRTDNGSYHVIRTSDLHTFTAWNEKTGYGLGNTTQQSAARWDGTKFYYAGSNLVFTTAGKPTITPAMPSSYMAHAGIVYNGKLYCFPTGGSVLKYSDKYVLEGGVSHGVGYFGTAIIPPRVLDMVAETGYLICSLSSHLIFIKP